MIKYYPAPDIEQKATEISVKLNIKHDFSRVRFIRSRGSQARRTLARCHALPRIMQTALGIKAHYIIEVIDEQYEKLSEEEKIKTLIHELMHIPKCMGGGFRQHDFVCKRNVEQLYRQYRNLA
jgi:predicted metallopeptidase